MTKWFMVIGLITNAKKGMSAKEIRRNIGITYKTAWYSAMRIRCGMVNNCKVLQNLVEMDEAYIGGKPRQSYTARDNEPNLSQVTNKRGRGTNKVPIVGIVERDGDIVLKVIETLTSKNLLAMLKETVKTTNAVVITDEYKSYKKFDEIVEHLTVNHSKKQYVKGVAHTNTLEGFFSILKNSIKGNYIAISKKYLPFYLVHAGYIYNHRNFTGNLFEVCLQDMVTHEKPMEHYKPVKPVNEIVYKQCKK
jgi:transposase-like protein